MTLSEKVREHVRPAMRLDTTSGRARFEIEKIGVDGLLLRVGKGRWPIRIPWRCFDRIEKEFSGKGWVRLGGTYGEPDEGTLESVIQSFTNGISAASYVAPILEECGLAEIDRDMPYHIEL
jgi:hypothetical protein